MNLKEALEKTDWNILYSENYLVGLSFVEREVCEETPTPLLQLVVPQEPKPHYVPISKRSPGSKLLEKYKNNVSI